MNKVWQKISKESEEVENKRNLLEDSLNELTIKANKVVGKK